jgi:hypothetical protein
MSGEVTVLLQELQDFFGELCDKERAHKPLDSADTMGFWYYRGEIRA